jgi:hypothetical protein
MGIAGARNESFAYVATMNSLHDSITSGASRHMKISDSSNTIWESISTNNKLEGFLRLSKGMPESK